VTSGESFGGEIGISDGFSGVCDDVCESTEETVELLVVDGAEVDDVTTSVKITNAISLWLWLRNNPLFYRHS
jgi:hypothetical protein